MRKLETFKFIDRYNWPKSEIQTEALVAARRRAELHGWSVINIRINGSEFIDKTRVYFIEVWGIDNE